MVYHSGVAIIHYHYPLSMIMSWSSTNLWFIYYHYGGGPIFDGNKPMVSCRCSLHQIDHHRGCKGTGAEGLVDLETHQLQLWSGVPRGAPVEDLILGKWWFHGEDFWGFNKGLRFSQEIEDDIGDWVFQGPTCTRVILGRWFQGNTGESMVSAWFCHQNLWVPVNHFQEMRMKVAVSGSTSSVVAPLWMMNHTNMWLLKYWLEPKS